MREELKQLINLQELDETVVKLKAVKDEMGARIDQSGRDVAAARQALEHRTAEAKSFRSALDSRDVTLKEIEGKISKLETQLNIIKTNKEYTTLQHEILGHKSDKSKIEDEILTMMEQEESGKAEIAELRRKLEEVEKAARERQQAAEDAVADAEARMKRLGEERKALAANIPAKWLEPYERLHRRGEGSAMAACRGFVCEGCRMSLTANTVNLLMGGDKIVFCHSCNRILYLAEDQDVRGGIGAGRRI